jgi:hypothetical protein
MSTWTAYQDAAQAYTGAVGAIFFPTVGPGLAEAERGPAPSVLMADQAERLVPLSDRLTEAIRELLKHEDPAMRAQAGTRMLAKALTDLHVSAQLLEAAQAEERQKTAAREDTPGPVPAAYLANLEQSLAILLAPPARGQNAASRRGGTSIPLPANLPAARMEIARAIIDALVTIRDQAARSGQTAIAGLLGLGATQLAQAVGIVGMDVAQAFGQGEQLSRLYILFGSFAMRAYNSLLALLGQQLGSMAANQMAAWVTEIQSGEQLGKLLDKLYDTPKTGADLGQLVATTQAAPAQIAATIQTLNTLKEQYGQQTALADKILRGVALFGIAPAAALPQGKLLLAAVCIVLGSYVILAGGDFVDAPRLRLLNRVPGVRQVVEAGLILPEAQPVANP